MGFCELYKKKTLELVPWICTHTHKHAHISHLTKVLC